MMGYRHLEDDEQKDLSAEFTGEEVADIEDDIEEIFREYEDAGREFSGIEDISEVDLEKIADLALERGSDWDLQKRELVRETVIRIFEREIERHV